MNTLKAENYLKLASGTSFQSTKPIIIHMPLNVLYFVLTTLTESCQTIGKIAVFTSEGLSRIILLLSFVRVVDSDLHNPIYKHELT